MSPGEPPSKKTKTVLSTGKVMIMVFWYSQGVIVLAKELTPNSRKNCFPSRQGQIGSIRLRTNAPSKIFPNFAPFCFQTLRSQKSSPPCSPTLQVSCYNPLGIHSIYILVLLKTKQYFLHSFRFFRHGRSNIKPLAYGSV